MVEMLPTAFLLLLAVSVIARNNGTCDGPCGLRFRQSAQGGVRLVGGQATQLGAWPWVVSLQIFMAHNNRRYHACGGMLLSSDWVLTAAHCFDNRKKVYDWRLVFGAREIEYGNNKPVRAPLQERYVEKIILHEKYNSVNEGNDIALLKITPPISCGPFVGPACLPTSKAGPPKVPQTCYVAGWGYIQEDAPRPSPVLLEARVALIDLHLCNSTQWYNGRVMPTNVCAGYPEGKIDTCQGDSGGPLMCSDNSNSPFVVVGITSWGVGCARAKRPGIYTATWDYLDWIASKIGPSALRAVQPATAPPPPTPSRPLVRPLPSRPPPTKPWYFQASLQPPQALAPKPRPPTAPPPPAPSPPAPPPPSPTSQLSSPTGPQGGLPFAQLLQRLIAALKATGSSGAQSSHLPEIPGLSEPFLSPDLKLFSTDL